MPIYEFQAKDGDVVERQYPISKAPALGKKITVNGKTFRRVLSLPPFQDSKAGTAGDYDSNAYPKLSSALPQFAEGAEYCTKPGNNFGKPIITSRAHQDDLCRRHGYVRDYSTSDY